MKPLDGDGKYRDTGAVFKPSLSRYRYTFISKGTFATAIKRLQHKVEIYTHLQPLQGHFIAIYLGSIALDTPYPLAAANVIHILLMSCAGNAVTVNDDVLPEKLRLQELLHTQIVIHDDLRQENLFFNYERERIMPIDFDLAITLPAVRHRQVEWLSHKRKRHLL
ncbi:hypothetical protein B0J13DRAFT_453133 [Dactylonectria estremocensis]|uniref:Uncharacterized protein n=1 Tax=Dactylonectria estremocensis TaxID=1079267 RepID=A0A9P9ISF4_9HYPO|nr:hypothetical protein B0J13DRAFT_453133 [Dactylonectria estremocensis]